MGQILFALNNEAFDFIRETDTHYFEGLAFVGGTAYKLIVSS